MASPTFTHVYAALAAVVNSKFPNIGELLLKRLILNFKRGYRRNDKTRCVSSTRFIAHLINQQVRVMNDKLIIHAVWLIRDTFERASHFREHKSRFLVYEILKQMVHLKMSVIFASTNIKSSLRWSRRMDAIAI